MAIISIPSSIGGIAIPGGIVNALAKGPLSALLGNKYALEFYQYPRDLASATRGHVVEFTIYEVEEAQYEKTVDTSKASFAENVQSTVQNAATNFKKAAESVNLKLQPKRKKAAKSIALYMPETMAFTYNATYGETNLIAIGRSIAAGGQAAIDSYKPTTTAAKAATTAGNAAAAAGKGLARAISSNNYALGRLALNAQGLAVNPQKQLLFDGIGFREYQLMFTFTPYSREEARQVEEIIKAFKFHAAPRITESAAGMFFVVPSTIQPKFMFNGSENKKISKVAESVLTSVDVNYAPNPYWSSHSDGAPVQTMLTLMFKEIQLIDRNMIKDGY